MCVNFINELVFGITQPVIAFRFSLPIERLTKILTSIGAAPSFAKLSAIILAITGVWGVFEASSNLIKFTGKLFTKSNGEVRSELFPLVDL